MGERTDGRSRINECLTKWKDGLTDGWIMEKWNAQRLTILPEYYAQ